MHHLIERAVATVNSWESDDPRHLAVAVEALCRDILDAEPHPAGDSEWIQLRKVFDEQPGQSLTDAIFAWDHQMRHGDFDLSDKTNFVQLGILTWTVRLLMKKLGMLVDTTPGEVTLEEFKADLCHKMEKYIEIRGRSTN